MSELPPPTVPPATPPPPGGGSYVPPPPPAGGAAPGSDRTLMIALSYLWILGIVPLLAKKDDPEVQWHAKNGLVLLGAEIVANVLVVLIRMMLRNSALGCALGFLGCAVFVLFLVVRIMAIMKGVNGQRFRMPVISDFADKF